MRSREEATAPRLQDADGFYEALIEAHEGLDAEESHRLNARLILLLAAEIADDATLQSLLQAAVAAGQRGSRTRGTG